METYLKEIFPKRPFRFCGLSARPSFRISLESHPEGLCFWAYYTKKALEFLVEFSEEFAESRSCRDRFSPFYLCVYLWASRVKSPYCFVAVSLGITGFPFSRRLLVCKTCAPLVSPDLPLFSLAQDGRRWGGGAGRQSDAGGSAINGLNGPDRTERSRTVCDRELTFETPPAGPLGLQAQHRSSVGLRANTLSGIYFRGAGGRPTFWLR